MGFIDTNGIFGVEGGQQDFFATFYNVVHAVGENCPNNRDDVMMVQYLLFWTYAQFPPANSPQGEMTIDGICGRITKGWISRFQEDVTRSGNSIRIDKRVDRMRDKNGMAGSISSTYYTLAYLNWFVGYGAPEAYLTLPQFVPVQNAGDVPPPSADVVIPEPPQLVPAVGGI